MFDLSLLPTAYILTIFPALMIFAAVGDAMLMKISNRLVMLVAISFFIGAFLISMPLMDVFIHTITAIGFYILGFGLFCLRISGAGDFKLLSVVALWLGPSNLLLFLMLMSFAGVFVVILYYKLRQYNIPLKLQRHFLFLEMIATGGKYVPYGIAICIGALFTYQQSFWFEGILV